MTLTALIIAAKVYGIHAVSWVVANAGWLIPMGSAAITLIRQMFS